MGWDIEGYRGDGKGTGIRKRLIHVRIKYVMRGKHAPRCQMRGVSELISGHGPAISNFAETKSLNALSSTGLLN